MICLLVWVTYPLYQLYGLIFLTILGMFLVDYFVLVITCWIYSLRWDRTGLGSIVVLTIVVFVISAVLWLKIFSQIRLRVLKLYYHIRGVRVSDHLKKKIKIHRPKNSQVVPLNAVTEEKEELEESEHCKPNRKKPST